MKRVLALVLAALAASAFAAGSDSLYAVSMRTYSDPSYHGVEGNLYAVSTETGVTRLLTALTVDGKTPVGLDGLAIHPRTGVFYGLTAGSSAVIPRSLVTLDPATGMVKLIGDLGIEATDMDFDPEGVLYAWLPARGQLARVDLQTGVATPIGTPMSQGALKGGIALVGGGLAVIAANGGKGTLDTLEMATGKLTRGPQLAGAPFEELINGLAYSPTGVLYAINSNGARPPVANLVRIDRVSGRVTNIGPLPNETDALSFGPDLSSRKDVATSVWEWRMPVLVVLFLVAVAVVVAATRMRKD